MKVFESKWTSAIAGAAFGVLVTCGSALAQAPAAPGKPESTSFDDWQVRCFPVQSPSPCDMFQELLNQQRTQRILAISIAYVPSMDRYALQITVPLGMSLPKGLSIQTDSYTSPNLRYRRCDREGCYVELGVDKSLVEGIAKSSPDGKAKVNIVVDTGVTGAGKAFGLTFFLKGFAAAHDNMVSQARAKAKAVAAQPGAAAPAAPAAPAQ
jgi:invasion protein IalB